MPGLIISLMKNDSSIGTMVYKFNPYFFDAFSRAKELIDSYNRNLVGVCTVDELFAARFFDKDTLKGTNGTAARPMYLKNTLDCIKEITNKFEYVFDEKSCRHETYGIVAIEFSDRLNINDHIAYKDAAVYVNIDLDHKLVSFGNIFTIYEKHDYVEMCGRDPYTLNKSPYNYEYLPFNQIEEACDFIFKNTDGFIDNYDENYIYVPYNTP